MVCFGKESTTFDDWAFDTGYTPLDFDNIPIDYSTLTVKHQKGEECPLVIKLPFFSAAMQAVTGTRMAVALAQQGGLGVIYASQPADEEALMVKNVKRSRAGFVTELDVLSCNAKVSEARELMSKTGFTIIPVVEGDKKNYGKLMGIIYDTISDNVPADVLIEKIMRPFRQESLEEIVRQLSSAASEEIITSVREYFPFVYDSATLSETNNLLEQSKLKAIPVINEQGELKSMVFSKDLQTHRDYPKSNIGTDKRYRVGAAVTTHPDDYLERIPKLVEAGADILFVDASDGCTGYQKETVNFIKKSYSHLYVIGGNVINKEGFQFLVDAGADAVKVGMGVGSICTTQQEKGTGKGQASAVYEIAQQRDTYFKKSGIYIPIISDGGVKRAYHILMALAFGADAVMMGKMFAGCDESPTPVLPGIKYKPYWGEGSSFAKKWRKGRYSQNDFDEGVVGRVPYVGRLEEQVKELIVRMNATMKSLGCHTISELRNARVHRLSQQALKEAGINVELD